MVETIPQRFDDLTPAYLSDVLARSGALSDQARVADRRIEPLGEGHGFVGSLARIHLQYRGAARGPQSAVVKLPGHNRRHRALAELGQAHEREVRFYRELASRSRIGAPAVYAAQYDPDPRESSRDATRARIERLPACLVRAFFGLGLWMAGRSRRRYLLLLEDLHGFEPGDQLAGAAVHEARRIAEHLARLHAGFWGDEVLSTEWIPSVDSSPATGRVAYRLGRRRFLSEQGDALPAIFMDGADWVDRHLPRIVERLAGPPRTLIHGDFRLDNLMFRGDAVAAVDWQSIAKGAGVIDWAYFATGSLSDAVSEAEEEALLGDYHTALVGEGVGDYPFESCRRDYLLAKLLMGFGQVASARLLDLEGERGRELLAVMRSRVIRRMPHPPWSWLL